MRRPLGIQSGIRFAALTLAVLLVFPYIASAQSGGGGSAPSGGTGPSTAPAPRSPGRSSPAEQTRRQVFLTGRVLSDLGRPVAESVGVQLICGMRTVQSVYADLGGYFSFNIGSGGFHSNFDFSASNDSPQMMGGFNTASSLPQRYGDNALAGCELRVSVPGYFPLSHTIHERSEIGRVDLGTIRLTRIGGTKEGDVSVATLMVPKNAMGEFEKAVKELQKSKPDVAVKHLEKAVTLYEPFAAAWNELGRIYQSRGLKEKAVQSFEKAADSDKDFVAPLLNLATLHIQEREWEKGATTAERALEIDPSVGMASFLAAVGHFNLHNLEAAERSAQEADQDPDSHIPQVHALLSQIYLEKQDFPQAVTHMRTYLAESPDGHMAEQIRQDLAEVERWVPSLRQSADEAQIPEPPSVE